VCSSDLEHSLRFPFCYTRNALTMVHEAMFNVVPLVFVGMAFLFSLLGNTFCETIKFNSLTSNIPNRAFGMWLQQQVSISIINNNLYVGQTCVSYSNSIDIDPYWKTARAFAVLAPIFGVIVMLLICPCTQVVSWKKQAGWLLQITALFQGFCLFILSSNACKASEVMTDLSYLLYDEKCSLGWGAKLNISALVFWWFAGMILLIAPSSNAVAETGVDNETSPTTEKDEPKDPEPEEEPIP